MMPVIRLNDAAFIDLKSISTWLSTKTPSETISKLIREKMHDLGLERESGVMDPSKGVLVSKENTEITLEFTRIIQAQINDVPIKKNNWSGLLWRMISVLKEMGFSGKYLANELQIPVRPSEFTEDGYTYDPEMEISIQGQSAPNAWKEVDRLAKKWKIPVEVEFKWKDNIKAQYPGQIGKLQSGKE